MDGILGQTSESVEVKAIPFEPLEEKEWALKGRNNHADGKSRQLHSAPGVLPMRDYPNYISWLRHAEKKFKEMEETEVRYETYEMEEADLVLVAYGYTARVSREAINMAREGSFKVGMIRPITLWPFPYKIINERAKQGCKFLVVEDSLGSLIEDVKMGVEGRTEVNLVGILDRHIPTDGGVIMPGRVLEEIKRLL
jgi:2-oxoglutarate ferredoxin oxidoreductase subunit alpha